MDLFWYYLHDMLTKRTIIIAALAVLAAGAIGWRLYQNAILQPPGEASEDESTDVPAGESSASPSPAGAGIEGSGNYTVQVLPSPQVRSGLDIPPLRRPLVFSAAFSAEARDIMKHKIEASITVLEKNPRDFDEWMNLAILRKTADDYEGAAQVWEFLTKTNPEQVGPYANLAALYTFELKNPALAEKNYTQAIQRGPKEVLIYRNAYDFYRYVQKDDQKARQILRDGNTQTGSADLKYLLDHYNDL